MTKAQLGLARRIVRTTPYPSRGSRIFRSDNLASSLLLCISCRVCGTLAAVLTSNPCRCKMSGSLARVLSSSSTKRRCLERKLSCPLFKGARNQRRKEELLLARTESLY